MKIVIDVSAAYSVIIGTPASEHFLSRLESATQVLAPDLFYSEAANTAWKFHHIEDLSPEESRLLVNRAVQLVDLFIPSEILWEKALDLACELSHPTYDCLYLVLARQQKATLLTNDKRLLKLAKAAGVAAVGPEGS